ncbi:Tumor protein p63-regulated gene 1-like protein [Gryllus bimaculatus]|nr:Tumor protein p63-regulated gene 1-like protein [Gryllus bimaculatus]
MSSNFGKDNDINDEILLEDGPLVDFHGATLQIQQDLFQSRSPSSLGDDSESAAKLAISPDNISDSSNPQPGKPIRQAEEPGKSTVCSGSDAVSPITSIPKKISETLRRSRTSSAEASNNGIICQNPVIAQEDAKDFFSYRDGLVENAVRESISDIVSTDSDGAILGNWLLTEISLWDNEKERLILLTENSLITVKYDFIALKQLEHRKIPLETVDTLVIGDLIYPSGSLVPRLNGLATGVVSVVKGCLLKPLQERWTRVPPGNSDFCASPFDFTCFEPRSRNMRGLRAMWNRGEPLAFSKKWNPFNNEIPWTTFSSHPLFWHKDKMVKKDSALY